MDMHITLVICLGCIIKKLMDQMSYTSTISNVMGALQENREARMRVDEWMMKRVATLQLGISSLYHSRSLSGYQLG